MPTAPSRTNGNAHQCSYPAMLRLSRIEQIIRAKSYPTKESLAVELEVSENTIRRDLRYMRNSLNMHFEHDRQRGGYVFTRETIQLPGVQIGTKEMLALQVVRRAVEAQRDPGLALLVGKTIDSLAVNMGKALEEECKAMNSLISYRSNAQPLRDEADSDVFPVLVTAALRCEEVELQYWGAEDLFPEARRIRPLHLFFYDQNWYLFCQDLDRKLAIRRLMLTRMSQIRCTGQKFKRPRNFNAEKLMENTVGIYGGGEPENIRLRLHGVVPRYLDERPLHPSQKIVPDPPHHELTVRVAITPELEGMILRWGSRIEVLEPLSLRETILQNAREIVARG